jgi:hypothetical protein
MQAKALGVGCGWCLGHWELIDVRLAKQPITAVPTAPERRKGFTVIEGGRKDLGDRPFDHAQVEMTLDLFAALEAERQFWLFRIAAFRL